MGKPAKKITGYLPVTQWEGKRVLKNRLNTLIDFVNANIDLLREPAFLRMQNYFFCLFYAPVFGSDPYEWDGKSLSPAIRRYCADTPRDRAALKYAQSLARLALEDIKTISKEAEKEKCQQRVWSFDLNLGAYANGEVLELWPAFPPDQIVIRDFGQQESEEIYLRNGVVASILELPSLTFSHFQDRKPGNTVMAVLSILFTKIPIGSIHRCTSFLCDRYFTATKGKRLPFCRTCIKRKAVQEWRKENRRYRNTYENARQAGHIENMKKEGTLPQKPRPGEVKKYVEKNLMD